MFGDTWRAYFEHNTRAEHIAEPRLKTEVSPCLRALLVESLGRFQLGEAAGGRIHAEIAQHPDRALDTGTRRAVQLYIEEEWRHARELASIIYALGGQTQTEHWTNDAFTFARRILGLRTKLMTLAVAEVVGIVYYRALATKVGSPNLARALLCIADEEARHLDFQAAFFAHAIKLVRSPWRAIYRLLLQALLFAITAFALVVLLADHGKLLRRLNVGAASIVKASLHELTSRRFLRAEPSAAQSKHCSMRSTLGAVMAHSNARRDT
jgi:hypothetical protein